MLGAGSLEAWSLECRAPPVAASGTRCGNFASTNAPTSKDFANTKSNRAEHPPSPAGPLNLGFTCVRTCAQIVVISSPRVPLVV